MIKRGINLPTKYIRVDILPFLIYDVTDLILHKVNYMPCKIKFLTKGEGLEP